MPKTHPSVMPVEFGDLPNRTAEVADLVRHGGLRVVVEHEGTPVMAVISVDDLKRLAEFERRWNERTEAIRAFGDAFRDVPTAEREAEIARIVAEGPRAEHRAEEHRSA